MGDTSEDDSLGDALSDYNEAFFVDAKEELDSEEEQERIEEIRINKQLENEIDLYFMNDTFNYNEEYNLKIRTKLIELNDFDFNCHKNIDKLKELAINNYGLINNKFRKKAWKLLILKDNFNIYDNFDNKISQKQIETHSYHNQVKLDVVRTLKRFPPQISNDLRSRLQNQLINIICKILIKNKGLHYYQGYHDICLTFLLVTGTNDCVPLVSNVTLTHFKPFMDTNMERTMQLLSNIVPLIDTINSDVAEHLEKAELGVIFGLSWLITWYSHVSDDLKVILRLFDFFIASDPMMPVYLGAIMICERSEEILAVDCDMASLHTFITKFPSQINDLDYLESMIKKTIQLFKNYPVESLKGLSEQWKIKREEIQRRYDEISDDAFTNELRYRGNNNNNQVMQGNNNKQRTIIRRKLNNKAYVNRFIMGFFTIGVAAAAVYVFTTNPKEPTEDLFMKFYHLLSYKNF